jgi:CHAT domain-containing protein
MNYSTGKRKQWTERESAQGGNRMDRSFRDTCETQAPLPGQPDRFKSLLEHWVLLCLCIDRSAPSLFKSVFARMLLIAVIICTLILGALQTNAYADETAAQLIQRITELNAQGKYSEAIPIAEKLVEMAEREFGPEHANTATSLNNLAVHYWAQERLPEAAAVMKKSAEIDEHLAQRLLGVGDESRKHAYVATRKGHTDANISFSLASRGKVVDADSMGLTAILQGKSRVLDVLTDMLAAARRSSAPEDERLLDTWIETNSQYAALERRGPEKMPPQRFRELLDELRAKVESLVAQLSERNSVFRSQRETITVDRVQRTIPEDTVLIEWFRYLPFNPKATGMEPRWGPARYVVYVLKRQGAPVAIDMGEAAPIEAAAAAFRSSVAERRSDVRQRARALDALTLEKVRPLMGDASALLISPDGALNLVPFAALVDDTRQYLIERYQLSYLTSGRDLLRQSTEASSREVPLILGDADFGGAFGSAGTRGEGKRAADMKTLVFGPLPETAKEVKAIGQILRLPGDRILSNEAATEGAVKAVKGPRILHLATHGFFLPDLPAAPVPDVLAPSPPATGGRLEDPLLRSGIALSGFKRRQEAKDANDGVLTALEVAGLDLWGTEVVALSACETGVGEVRVGEGVFGLRRALVLAGAQSQLMTLWQVADEPTKELMVSWYSQLQQGFGRAEALHQAQLAALRGEALPITNTLLRGVKLVGEPEQATDPRIAGTRHPYYWASFILSGATGPISSTK